MKVYKGNILTVNKTDDVVKYLVEDKGRIVFVGDELPEKYASQKVTDLGDKALIPSFCGEGYYGLRVHEEALKKGVKVTGATANFVNEICDGGPIIIQKAVEVQNGDTPEVLQKRVMEQAEWLILPHAVDLFCNDKIKVIGNITEILE